MDGVEDYWERGAGSAVPSIAAVNHALAIYGWDLHDAPDRAAAIAARAYKAPQDDLIKQLVETTATGQHYGCIRTGTPKHAA